MINACPSGALRVSVDGEDLHHMDFDEQSVSFVKNGPYVLKNIPLNAEFNGAGASEKGIYPLPMWAVQKQALL